MIKKHQMKIKIQKKIIIILHNNKKIIRLKTKNKQGIKKLKKMMLIIQFKFKKFNNIIKKMNNLKIIL